MEKGGESCETLDRAGEGFLVAPQPPLPHSLALARLVHAAVIVLVHVPRLPKRRLPLSPSVSLRWKPLSRPVLWSTNRHPIIGVVALRASGSGTRVVWEVQGARS